MSMEDLLKSLQRDYVAALPEKLDTIRGQIRDANPQSLRDSFHKLKGTGRTYGLPEISELAEVVERICFTLPAEATAASQIGAMILQDIFSSRNAGITYNLHSDPRFEQIRRLLPS